MEKRKRNKMKQTLAIMRTHKINYAIVSEFEKMQNCGVDTLLLINNSYGKMSDYLLRGPFKSWSL